LLTVEGNARDTALTEGRFFNNHHQKTL
jgi:hypothetical protein